MIEGSRYFGTHTMDLKINLTPQHEEMVRQKIDSGLYSSVSDVVREALRMMDEKDQLEAAKLDQLRRDVQEGLSSGPSAVWDPAEVKAAGRAARATKAGGAV